MNQIFKCSKCNDYTLEGKCPKCSSKTSPVKPAKFNPDDKYGKYRREVKLKEREEQGLV